MQAPSKAVLSSWTAAMQLVLVFHNLQGLDDIPSRRRLREVTTHKGLHPKARKQSAPLTLLERVSSLFGGVGRKSSALAPA